MGGLRREDALVQDLVDDRQDFGQAFACGLQRSALVGEGDLDALDDAGPPRLLGLGRFGAEAHELEKVAKPLKARSSASMPLKSHIVAAHDER